MPASPGTDDADRLSLLCQLESLLGFGRSRFMPVSMHVVGGGDKGLQIGNNTYIPPLHLILAKRKLRRELYPIHCPVRCRQQLF